MTHKTCILISLLLVTAFAQWTYLPGSLNFGGPIIASHDTLLMSRSGVTQMVANDSTKMTNYPLGLTSIRAMLKFHDSVFAVGNGGVAWGDMTGANTVPMFRGRKVYSIAIAVDTTIPSPTKYPVDTIFIGTDSGVYYSPSDSPGYLKLPRCKYWFPKNNGLVTKINAINYWYGVPEVGTDSGVFYYQNNKWVRDDYDFPALFAGTASKKINTIYSDMTYSINTGSTWFVGTDSGFCEGGGNPTIYLAGKHILSFCAHGTTLFVGTDSLVYRFPDPYDFSNYTSLGTLQPAFPFLHDSLVSIACNDNYLYVVDHVVDITRPTQPQSPLIFYMSLNQTSIIPVHKVIPRTLSQSYVKYFSLNGRRITTPRVTGLYIRNTNTITVKYIYTRGY